MQYFDNFAITEDIFESISNENKATEIGEGVSKSVLMWLLLLRICWSKQARFMIRSHLRVYLIKMHLSWCSHLISILRIPIMRLGCLSTRQGVLGLMKRTILEEEKNISVFLEVSVKPKQNPRF